MNLYTWLVPVFFVLHNWWQYEGLIPLSIALKLFLQIELITTVGFFILRFLLGSGDKAAMITAAANVLLLFFGNIRDGVNSLSILSPMASYKFLLPTLLLLFVVVVLLVSRKKYFEKSSLFLGILLLLFILADFARIAWGQIRIKAPHNSMVYRNSINLENADTATVRPDVYLLVFDSYPGQAACSRWLGFSNAAIDSALIRRGFYVVRNAMSNYNRTALSMASELNMQYLAGVLPNKPIEPIQYNQCMYSVRESKVPAVFDHFGYSLVNLSCFDLKNVPAFRKEDFLALPPERMFLYSTFLSCFRRDIGWHFPGLPVFGKESDWRADAELQQEYASKKRYNDAVIDSLLHLPMSSIKKPFFVYVHLYLPHPPFFYDANGHELQRGTDLMRLKDDKTALHEYIQYTNKKMLQICDTIIAHTNRPLAIVLQSDHGYRDLSLADMPAAAYYNNFSAIYYSDKQYGQLYDRMSNVNVFPMVFNKYFRTSIPLQADSIVHIPY